MTTLFSKPDSPTTSTPEDNSAELEAAAAQERNARGRASTILTGPQGLVDSAQTSSQVLLGA